MIEFRSSTRPVGITIIASLMLLFAVFGICGAAARLGFSPLAVFDDGVGGFLRQSTGAIWAIILAVANIFLALGLFGLRRWAYYVTLLIEVLALVTPGVAGIGAPRLACGYHLIPLIIVIYMLVDGNVRRAFRI